ncbi:MAG: ABC transporter ATP-binding protein [Actinobacteria bacterium]|nr:ABC transporter ATP-binding protein [Actinomycetota bacterium]
MKGVGEIASPRQDLSLSVAGLTVGVRNGPAIIEDVSMELLPSEIVGVVGESGSGKTTLGLSLLGYCRPGAEVRSGTLELGGVRVAMDGSMRTLRGRAIAYVPQDPGQALNPALRIRAAIEDIVRAHRERSAGLPEISTLLEAVNLPSSAEFSRRFPHQISGGQKQRVSIAMALSCHPGVVVLDEPTTGLDVETQSRILDELLRLRAEYRIAMIYVTHDLAVVGKIADRIAVMYAGRIVEQGPTAALLSRPRHPYTRGLLLSIPDHRRPRRLEPMRGIAVSVGEWPKGCPFAPRCPQATSECEQSVPPSTPVTSGHEVRCFRWESTPPVSDDARAGSWISPDTESEVVLEVRHLRAEHRGRGTTVVAAADISFQIRRGECLALVGESGSGKTTIARAIAGLHADVSGEILLAGSSLTPEARRRSVAERRRIQLVVQNPKDALNPRHTVRQSIARPIRVLRDRSTLSNGVDGEIDSLLERVRLPQRIANSYPDELSGGETQRVAIARALAADPELMICDEITSALDVSVQAAVLRLLRELQTDFGLSLLFITHNLGLVATIADDLLVLEDGVICERGVTSSVLGNPQHQYTKRLIAAAPSVDDSMADRI